MNSLSESILLLCHLLYFISSKGNIIQSDLENEALLGATTPQFFTIDPGGSNPAAYVYLPHNMFASIDIPR